jgi:hypothetical protein
MAEQQFRKLSLYGSYASYPFVTCGPKTTLYSAAVASPATARLARICGLAVKKNKQLQRIAGLHADAQTLTVLQELDMPLNDRVLNAVALSGRLEVLQHVVIEQKCRTNSLLSHYAARSGSIRMLKWLRAQSWCTFDESICAGAAKGGHLPALKYLHSEGFKWYEKYIAHRAAGSGSI